MKSIEFINICTPNRVGWLEMKLSSVAMNHLWEYVDKAEQNCNKNLAGQISRSLSLKDKDNWFFEKICLPAIHNFCTYFNTVSGKTFTYPHHYTLGSFWVNYQKKHEFNPPHDHTGVFSFVIFMKIPTDYRKQHKLPVIAQSNQAQASNFVFQFVDILGRPQHYSYFLDPNSAATMLFFPASLIHMVHPFYKVNGDRITIAGNIMLDSKNIVGESSTPNQSTFKFDQPPIHMKGPFVDKPSPKK
jgi:hypothetical protein